eukprot:tig00020603_g11759.t1
MSPAISAPASIHRAFSRVWLREVEDDSADAKKERERLAEQSKRQLEAVADGKEVQQAVLTNETVKRRKRIIMSEQKLPATYQCFTKGFYNIQVTVHEARDLQPADRDGTSDPYVEVAIHNKQRQKTAVRQSTLNTIWDELLVYDHIEVDEPQELERGKIKIFVKDKDSIGTDVDIGACDIDISYVYRQPKHLICQRWIPLVDPNAYTARIQGWLKVSCAIMGPGDPQQIDVSPAQTDVNDLGNGYYLWRSPKPPKNFSCYLLRVNIAKAEYLPQMDFSFTTRPKDSVDAFVRVSFGGVANRKTAVVSSCNPVWNTTITIPVLYPSIQTDNVSIYVMDHDVTSEDDIVATVSPSISFRELHHNVVKHKKPAPYALSWINLYGAPPDRTLTLQGALEKMKALARSGVSRVKDEHEILAERMNEGHVPGSYYRGRLLMRAYVEGPVENHERLTEAELENAPFYMQGDDALPPPARDYVLRFDCFESAFVGGRSDYLCVEVTVGPWSEFSRPAPARAGRAEWNSFFRRRLELPESPEEIPDVFVNVYAAQADGTLGPRLAYRRIVARELFPDRAGAAPGQQQPSALRALFLGSAVTENLDSAGRAQGTWAPLRRDTYSGGLHDEEWAGFLHFAIQLTPAAGTAGLDGLEESDAASIYSTAAGKIEAMPEWRPTVDLRSALELQAMLPRGRQKLFREAKAFESLARVPKVQHDVVAYIYGASRLDCADENGLADPYVELMVGNVSDTTHAESNTLYPTWNKEIKFCLDLPDADQAPAAGHGSMLVQPPLWPLCCFRVWDKDKLARDQFMGHCFFPLPPRGTDNAPFPEAFPLYKENPSSTHGQIYAVIQVVKAGVPRGIQPRFLDTQLMPCRLTFDLLGLRGMPVLTTALSRAVGALVPQTFVIDMKLGSRRCSVEWPPKELSAAAGQRAALAAPRGFGVYNRLLATDQERNTDSPNIVQAVYMDVMLPPYPPIAGALVVRVKSVRADIRTTVGQVTVPLANLYAHALKAPPLSPAPALAVGSLPAVAGSPADPAAASAYPAIYSSVESTATGVGDAWFGQQQQQQPGVQMQINSSAFLPNPSARAPLIPAGAPDSAASPPGSPEQVRSRGMGKISRLLRREAETGAGAIAAALPPMPGTKPDYQTRIVGGTGLFGVSTGPLSGAREAKRTASGAWMDWDEFDLDFLRHRPLFDCELEVYIADVPFDTFNLTKGSSRFRIPFLKATDMGEEMGRIKGRLTLHTLAPHAAQAAQAAHAQTASAAAAGGSSRGGPVQTAQSKLPEALAAVEDGARQRDALDLPEVPGGRRSGVPSLVRLERVVVRVYVLRGLNLPPRDLGGSSDPYLVFSLGEQKSRRKEHRKTKTLQPMFYDFYETQTTLPGASLLKVEVWDYDTADKDDFIGETVIDLENRWYSRTWRNNLCHHALPAAAPAAAGAGGAGAEAGSGAVSPRTEAALRRGRPTRAPVERRTLFDPVRKSAMGKLEMIVEILTVEEASRIPAEKVISPANEFEMRVVVWGARKMVSKDPVTKMNDLCVTGVLEAGNGVEPQSQETDTHLRAKDGKGSFNWRMVYQLSLPIAAPVFKVQAWDVDLVGRDSIGESVIDLSPLCKDALRLRRELINNGECCSMIRRWLPLYHPTKPGALQGEVEIQLDLWPKEVAARRARARAPPAAVGNKREEPNRYPSSRPGAREAGAAAAGPHAPAGPRADMCRKFGAVVCVGAFVICLVFMLPMIFSNVIVAFIKPG